MTRIKLFAVHLGMQLLAIAIVAFANHASADAKPTFLPDKVGVWRKWAMSCDGSGHGLTSEQNSIYGSKLYKLSEVIHHSPFSIRRWGSRQYPRDV
jgi:hypothetical protein